MNIYQRVILVLGAIAFVLVRTTAVILVMSIISVNCYSVERTEAQRYYDLGVSYIKSDLYEKGLETLNQVAFLYPDSDVSDDALYQLALIREQVGDGRIVVGEMRRLETVKEELDRLKASRITASWAIAIEVLLAYEKGERVLDIAKERAVAQYVLALDYLNTLTQRYPDSDRLGDSGRAFERIVGKINRLTQPTPPKPPRSTTETIFTFIGMAMAMVVFSFLLVNYAKNP